MTENFAAPLEMELCYAYPGSEAATSMGAKDRGVWFVQVNNWNALGRRMVWRTSKPFESAIDAATFGQTKWGRLYQWQRDNAMHFRLFPEVEPVIAPNLAS